MTPSHRNPVPYRLDADGGRLGGYTFACTMLERGCWMSSVRTWCARAQRGWLKQIWQPTPQRRHVEWRVAITTAPPKRTLNSTRTRSVARCIQLPDSRRGWFMRRLLYLYRVGYRHAGVMHHAVRIHAMENMDGATDDTYFSSIYVNQMRQKVAEALYLCGHRGDSREEDNIYIRIYKHTSHGVHRR